MANGSRLFSLLLFAKTFCISARTALLQALSSCSHYTRYFLQWLTSRRVSECWKSKWSEELFQFVNTEWVWAGNVKNGVRWKALVSTHLITLRNIFCLLYNQPWRRSTQSLKHERGAAITSPAAGVKLSLINIHIKQMKKYFRSRMLSFSRCSTWNFHSTCLPSPSYSSGYMMLSWFGNSC